MSDEERFSLKDHLFNEVGITELAKRIKAAYPRFKDREFTALVVEKFPELELMQRIAFISEMLRMYLPTEYDEAIGVLLKSLPPPCDPAQTDNDFGSFLYAPYGHFVSEYGCTKAHLKMSLSALKEITQRFSAEWAIRNFLNTFPKETLAELKKWTKDSHYHVRRLVSEGTRPNLPWAKKVYLTSSDTIPLLDALYADNTRFVTRSVANHLNDIAKREPDLVVATLKRWHKEGKQTETELVFITKHALRTLVKNGHAESLEFLGHGSTSITLKSFAVETPKVKVGEALQFSFILRSTDKVPQDFLIDYVLYFRKANGELTSKVHKITKKSLAPQEECLLNKKHPLRIMTTRKLYPGEHKVALQVNGKQFEAVSFLIY